MRTNKCSSEYAIAILQVPDPDFFTCLAFQKYFNMKMSSKSSRGCDKIKFYSKSQQIQLHDETMQL